MSDTSNNENIFAGLEDKLFKQAEIDYEQERKKLLDNAACRIERKRLMVSSDRYLATLEQMQKKAEEAESKVSSAFEDSSRKFCSYSADIQKEAERALSVIKRQAAHTEKIVKITSREHRMKFVTLLAAAFFGGIVMTVFVYHAFIIGIMNRYLHHTIELMAQEEISEARREAETILRNANIKADGILKNADSFASKDKDQNLKGDKK